jgi:hypothetical protein
MTHPDQGGAVPLLRRAREGAAAEAFVSHLEVQRLLAAQADRQGLSLAEWHEVVAFASDQCARWQVRWLFSPAAEPDAVAAAELEGWRVLHAACAEALLTRVPEVRARLERQHELTALRQALRRRLEGTEGRMGGRILPAILSQAAGFGRRLGMHRLAARLDVVALYPRRSVGRALARPSALGSPPPSL